MAEENNNNDIDNNVKKQNSEKVDLFVTSIDNFKELKEEVYVNKIKDLEKCKNIYQIIIDSKQNDNNLKGSDIIEIERMNKLILLEERVKKFYDENLNRNEENNKPKITFPEFEIKYQKFKNDLKDILKNQNNIHDYETYSLEILTKEINKIYQWLEKYQNFISKKKKKLFEQIDISLLEVMLNEAQTFMCSLPNETLIISNDVESTKNFIDLNDKLNQVNPNEVYSLKNINEFCSNENNLTQLNKVIIDFINNKILSNDKFLIDPIKTLDWCIKIRTNFTNSPNKVDFHTIYKVYQEGINLKKFNEIKKFDYITDLINQINISRKYKDLSELLSKSKNTKQISEEEFNNIINDYEKLPNCKIYFHEEKNVISNIIKLKNDFNNLYETYIKTRAKLTDYEKLLSNVDKFHVKLSDLHQKIKNIMNNTHNLQKEIKKLNKPLNNKTQLKSAFSILTFDKVQTLQNKIRNNYASFPEGETLIKNYDISLENISKLKKMIKDPNSDLYEMLSLKDEIIIHNIEDENEINKVIWEKKYNMLISSGKKPIPVMIEHLIYESKDYNINDTEKLKNLKSLYEEANNLINKIKKCNTENELNEVKLIVDKSNIDLNDILIERNIEINIGEIDNKNNENINKNNNINNNGQKNIIDIKQPINNDNKIEKIYSKKNLDEDEDYDEENSNEEEIKSHKTKSKLNKADALKKFSKDLLEDAENFQNIRGKRNIKRRFDKDFVYETEFVEEFNNKIAKRDEDENFIIGNENEEKEKEKEKKKEVKIIEDNEDKKEEEEGKKEILKLLSKKTKKPNKPNKVEQKKNEDDFLKKAIRDNSKAQFTKLFKSNSYFSKEGDDFINNQVEKLEKDLSIAHPKIDQEYQKTFNNMLKTIKEIGNYKKVSHLIIKGKITLFKISKFPFGQKFIQKLKDIEEGKKKKEEKINLKGVLSSVHELYSSLASDTNKNKKDEKNNNQLSTMNSEEFNISSHNYNEDNEDEDSLKSIEGENNIRFSPTNHEIKDKNSLNISSMSNPNDKNDYLYNPFEIENNDKIVSQLIFFPIFYDPSLKKENSYDNNYEINPNYSKIPIGSILRIFSGKLNLNRSQIDKVNLYSTNQFELFTLFPSLEKELNVNNKAKTEEVIPYCEKQFSNKSKIELYGWIEIDKNSNEEQITKFLNLIDEYDRANKCGCLVINGVKLYIFPLSNKYPRFYRKILDECKFINGPFMDSLEKILVFVLIANKSTLNEAVIKENKKLIPKLINESERIINEKFEKMGSPISDDDNNDNNNNNNNNVNEMNYNRTTSMDIEPNYTSNMSTEYIKDENEKLAKILEQNDMKILEEYINQNFNNLSQDDIIKKLMLFNEESQTKLLQLIMKYQQNNIEQEQINNEPNQNINNDINNENNVQQRIEEFINEEQNQRISQLNQPQQQIFYNPNIMSVYPQNMQNLINQNLMNVNMNDYNQMKQFMNMNMNMQMMNIYNMNHFNNLQGDKGNINKDNK